VVVSKQRLAVLGIAGIFAIFPVRAEEIRFDSGVDITPALEGIRRIADRAEDAPARSSGVEEDARGMVWVAMENADADAVRGKIDLARREVVPLTQGITLFPVKPEELPRLSHIMHERRDRCGGFFAYDSKEAAMADEDSGTGGAVARAYSISRPETVRFLLSKFREDRLRDTITRLSKFHNRYYSSDEGVASSQWILDDWAGIAKGRSDISVELFDHPGWPQSSVILTIAGSKEPGQVIVLGGHADSVGGRWGGSGARAPGADDNASGIAVLTEALRVIVDSGFRPERTVQLMAYSAEEVGLRGSRAIATQYASAGVDVQGVVQFDMTIFKGSVKSIYLITDYTNEVQNAYLGRLIDEYVKVPWGETRCGYACSDHASWTRNGFPASFPFEATKRGTNRNIHSSRDTLENVGGTADHAVPFARLAVAYIVETSKASASPIKGASGRSSR